MKPKIRHIHKVWKAVKMEDKHPALSPMINFDEIIGSIFSTGPFYFYIIDFENMSISHLSSGFEDIHGVKRGLVKNINDILSLIHPDDMSFVSEAESKALDFVVNKIGVEKATRYKGSYNFRFFTSDGSYQLFNHQALVIAMDESYKFMKSLNIHTNISHITKINNSKFSLIGLGGEPSYLNMDVYDIVKEIHHVRENVFSKREIEVIRLLAEGYGTKNIADKLYISPATAETHRKNILRKSGCDNSVMLVARSLSEGWI